MLAERLAELQRFDTIVGNLEASTERLAAAVGAPSRRSRAASNFDASIVPGGGDNFDISGLDALVRRLEVTAARAEAVVRLPDEPPCVPGTPDVRVAPAQLTPASREAEAVAAPAPVASEAPCDTESRERAVSRDLATSALASPPLIDADVVMASVESAQSSSVETRLISCDIQQVSWAEAQRARCRTNGELILEFEDLRAVRLRVEGFDTATLLAERLAQTLRVPVANRRAVVASTPEFGAIADAVVRACAANSGSADAGLANAPGFADMFNTAAMKCGFYGILEFVPGPTILEGDNSSPAVLRSLGRLAALDVLLNNPRGIPLPLWDGSGDLSRVVVAAEGGCANASPSAAVVGLDHAVHVLEDGPELDSHLARLRNFAGQLCLRSVAAAGPACWGATGITSTMRQAVSSAFDFPDASAALMVKGLREGVRTVAESWESGALLRCLEDAEKDLGAPGMALPGPLARFLRRAAAEVWHGARGLPPPSCLC